MLKGVPFNIIKKTNQQITILWGDQKSHCFYMSHPLKATLLAVNGSLG